MPYFIQSKILNTFLQVLNMSLTASPISIKIIYSETPQISTDITTFDNAITPILPAPANGASVNPLQIVATIGEILWLFGMVALLTYCILSLFRLRKNLIGAGAKC